MEPAELLLPRLPPRPSSVASVVFPDCDEDTDNFGFSWVPLTVVSGTAQEDTESGNRNEEELPRGRMGYEERLQADSVFHNPAALELMMSAYAIPPYFSFALSQTQLEEESVSGTSRGNRSSEEFDMFGSKWNYRTLQVRRHNYMSKEFTEKAIKLTREGKLAESQVLLDKALDYNGCNVNALVASGANFANAGHYSSAISLFETALLVDPNCENAAKYLASTKLKATEVRDISTITATAIAQRNEDNKADKNVEASNKGGKSNSVLIRHASKLYSSDNQEWSYVHSDDDYSDDDDPKSSKKKKGKRDKKSKKKKRKHKKDKSSKKSKKSRRDSSDESTSSDDIKDSESYKIHGRDNPTDTQREEEEELHPILSRNKHKLWN